MECTECIHLNNSKNKQEGHPLGVTIYIDCMVLFNSRRKCNLRRKIDEVRGTYTFQTSVFFLFCRFNMLLLHKLY